jgi:hypothetical protein
MKEREERRTDDTNFTNPIAFRLVFVAQLAIRQGPDDIIKTRGRKKTARS